MRRSGYKSISEKTTFRYECGLILAIGLAYEKSSYGKTFTLVLPFIVLSLEYDKPPKQTAKNTLKEPQPKEQPKESIIVKCLKVIAITVIAIAGLVGFISMAVGLLVLGLVVDPTAIL